MDLDIDKVQLAKEFTFRTSRSGGKGGQNVNKVSTKVELLWDFMQSSQLSASDKEKIAQRLNHRINKENILQVVAEEDRTQLRNKEIAIKKTLHLIIQSLKEDKPRKPSKPSKASVRKRLDDKRKQALKKINRGSGFDY